MQSELHIKVSELPGIVPWIREYLAEEIYRPLHSECMAFFAQLDYNSTADNMSCCRDIE
jgi:hypothetical protein